MPIAHTDGPGSVPQWASGEVCALHPQRLRIGEMLVSAGLISRRQLEEALEQQSTWGSRFGDIILAMGWVKPLDFYRVLARHFDLEFVNLIENPAAELLFDAREYQNYAQHLFLPWRLHEGTLWTATAEPGSP